MAPGSRKRRQAEEEVEDEEDEQSEEDVSRSNQRRRRVAPNDDSNSDDGDNGPSVEETHGDGDDANESQDQLVQKLVRYALSCEYSRIPIRRDGIREKVFGKHKMVFKQVFDAAQEQLQVKFGMQMVELPTKEKVTLKERRAAAQKSSQAPVSSRAYVLTSVLPKEYCIPAILGSSLVPTASEEASYIGLYTMIITLITLAGGTLQDSKLERYLNRMNGEKNLAGEKKEIVLQKMIRQGYLIKIKDKDANSDETIDWMIGPRGKVEVGVKGVQGLVTEIYGDSAPDDLTDRLNRSLGVQKVVRRNEEGESEAVQDNERSTGRTSRRRGAPEVEDD